MTTPYGGVSQWTGNVSASETLSFTSTPTTGDYILVWVYQSNENYPDDPNIGTVSAASAPNYTLLHHYSSPTRYRGVNTVLLKEADGSEQGVTVTWGTPAAYGAIISACFISGIDPDSGVFTSGDWAGSASYAANQEDLTIQAIGVTGNTGTGAFGTGASLISADWREGSFRGAGWAVSSGSTTASPSATSGSLLTMSFSEAAPPYTYLAQVTSYTTATAAPVVTISKPSDNESFQLPKSALVFGIGADNVDTLEARFPAINPAWTNLNPLRDGNGDIVDAEWDYNFTAGTFLFEARGSTNDGQSVVDSVSVEFVAAPAPQCINDNASTDMNTAVDVDVLSNDSNVDASTSLSIESDASNGTTTIL